MTTDNEAFHDPTGENILAVHLGEEKIREVANKVLREGRLLSVEDIAKEISDGRPRALRELIAASLMRLWLGRGHLLFIDECGKWKVMKSA